MIGQTISHYKITAKLGEGGMGVVYKAEDTKLKRTVALKFLPAHAVGEGEHRARFEREAQAAASLNHPNICTIHEIDEHEGRPFIAMEFVDGETLASVVASGPLKIDEVLDIAIQAARGLAEAHGRGIVHRDIKSANIMVAPERTGQERQVKLMDFGLAQLATARTQLTKEGSTLGTMAYMAPEQARGEKVDHRADIWALGVVLYEMVAGRQPYRADYDQAVLYSILNEAHEPLTAVRTGVPKELERIVDKALTKNTTTRYQHAEHMLVDLRALRSDLTVQRSRQAPAGLHPAGMKRPVVWVGVAAVLAVAAVFVLLQFNGRPVTPGGPAPVAVPFTSMPGVERDPAISPDGRQIAFTAPGSTASDWDIYVKQVGSPGQIRLTTGPDREYGPAWSPDGQQIAFVRLLKDKQEILLVPALGGPERKLSDIAYRSRDLLAWHPSGKYLAFVDRVDRAGILSAMPIWSVAIDTGEKKNLTQHVPDSPAPPGGADVQRVQVWDRYPAFSPDGRRLAFSRFTSGWIAEIYLLELDGEGTPRGEPRRLTFDQRDIQGLDWTADGRSIVFSSNRVGGQALWRIAIDGGEPERLVVGGDDASFPSVSRTGARLAYVQSTFDPNIWRVPGPHAPPAEPRASTSGANELIASTREDLSPDYSPDGKRIAFDSNRGGTQEIWVCDSDGSNAVQLTSFGGPPVGVPRWSPDGQWIAFDSRKEGDADIYIVAASGGAARRLTLDPGYDARPSWSADGRWIYFASRRSGDMQIWKIPSQGGEAVQITFQGGRQAFESADGNTVYYVKLGVDGVWRVPAAGGEETKILDSGWVGQWALLKDGICYINHSLPGIQFLDFATGRSSLVWRYPDETPLHADSFDASPDGKWVLYVQNDRNESDIMLVENFR